MTRASAVAASSADSGSDPGDRAGLEPRRLLGGQGGGDAQALGVGLLALAEPDHEHRRGVLGPQQGELLEGALASAAPGTEEIEAGRDSPSYSPIATRSAPASPRSLSLTPTFIGARVYDRTLQIGTERE